MSIATDLLTAVENELKGRYPDIEVKVRKGIPGPDPAEATAGWVPGDASMLLVVSCGEPEEADSEGCFEEVSLFYPIRVDYVKPNPPGTWQDDPDVRTKRQEIFELLYRQFTGLPPQFADISTFAARPYGPGGGSTHVSAGWSFVMRTWEPRPVND